MITHYFRTLQDTELKVHTEPRAGVWTHAVAPDEAELAQLQEWYNLDPDILEDASDFFEVPRFEKEGSVSYFFTRYPFDEKDEDIDTAPLMVAIGESFVLTVAQREVPFLQQFISGSRVAHTTQKTKFFLELMDSLTRAYNIELTRMRKAVYRDRTRVRAIAGRDIQRLVSYEHELNDAIAALVPTNNWIKLLSKGNHIQMYNEDVELMEDLVIDNNQLIESAMSILKTIQNIRSASEAMLTQKLNNTIQMLTALTIILTIPTIISSLYGMNVTVPLGAHPYAFWLVLVFILIVMSGAVMYFRRKYWF